MQISQLLLLQLIAHFLSDFIFQSDKIAQGKIKYVYKGSALYWHVLIGVIFSFILSMQWQFWYMSIFIGVIHFIIDTLKSVLSNKKIGVKYLFYIDQFLHLITIFFLVRIFETYSESQAYFHIDKKYLSLILGFLLSSKPANIFIKEVFKTYDIKLLKSNDLHNAGRLIGTLERWMILIFILTGQIEAIGFLLASKSILRFGEKDEEQLNKTEYVLIGTMLSFSIAIVVGLLIQKCKT